MVAHRHTRWDNPDIGKGVQFEADAKAADSEFTGFSSHVALHFVKTKIRISHAVIGRRGAKE
jgi:hypothetical protein